MSSVGIAAIAAADVNQNIQSKPGVHLVEAADPTDTAKAPVTKTAQPLSGAFNVLLVGADTRTDQGEQFADAADQAASSGTGNNDVTILLHVNASHSAATVVSFPRDLMLALPSCPSSSGGWYPAQTQAMLNTSLSYGGLACPVLTIEQLLGITDIDYAAEIKFQGVAAMSDAVGGVPVCLATAVDDPYTGLKLSAGSHTIKGQQALQFLRSRHGVDDASDLARISSQQNFLSSLLRTITSAGTLSNPVKLYELAEAATQNMTLSDTMRSTQTMVGMALALKSISLSNITFVQFPVIDDPDDANRVVADGTESTLLADAIKNDEPVTLTGTVGRGVVLATPTATATPTAAAASTPSSGSGAATSSASPTPSGVVLGQDVSGQTAAEQTCTKGVVVSP